MMKKFNSYHMVTMSPWPLIMSVVLWLETMKTITLLNMMKNLTLLKNFFLMASLMSMASWWKNTSMESSEEGSHMNKTMTNIKMAMLMFISSEIMFFLSMFWSYFHMMSSPSVETGNMWPPLNIKTFNPLSVPLLNTTILVSSGISITLSHHLMMKKMLKKSKKMNIITIILASYFTLLQAVEYKQAQFSFSDSTYGSCFFMTTGFHGAHVMMGTMFITASLLKMKKLQMSSKHHLTFEMSAWYWHFVDVVWLLLYICVYWWSEN